MRTLLSLAVLLLLASLVLVLVGIRESADGLIWASVAAGVAAAVLGGTVLLRRL